MSTGAQWIHTEPSDSLPQCLVYPAHSKHTATVIFLHGLGDSARELGPELKLLHQHPDLFHVKFVFPTAPLMSITGMKGSIMPSWFDCFSFDHANRREDETGLQQAANWIHDLISEEERDYGIPSNSVIVGGLSQGGSVAILTALTTKKPLGGVFLLSSYVPLRKKTSEIATEFAKQVPIFWGHGMEDRQVDFSTWKQLAEVLAGELEIPFISPDPSVKMTREELEENGILGLRFYSYEDLPHWFCHKELEDVAVWISVLVEDR